MLADTPIGRGRTAEIYGWKDGRILKLFYEWVRPDHVRREADIGDMVQAAGLPAPRVEGQITVEGRTGIVYERVEGATMLRQVVDNPWSTARIARSMAELHSRIHAVHLDRLPSLRDRLLERIGQAGATLPDAARQAALDALDRLPDGDAVCHGDFHPDNILMTDDGPIAIDWAEAARGHPLADVARTSLMISLGEPPPDADDSLRWRLNQVRAPFHDTYLEHYMALTGVTQKHVTAWQLPITVARLALRIPEEEGRVVGRIEWLT